MSILFKEYPLSAFTSLTSEKVISGELQLAINNSETISTQVNHINGKEFDDQDTENCECIFFEGDGLSATEVLALDVIIAAYDNPQPQE